MEKKFKVLRFIGTIWKILAWIVLIVGILSSIGVLLTSILGGGLLSQLGQEYGQMPDASWFFGTVGGIVAFIVSLIVTIIYFLMLYAVGELIYLLLSIEENSRLASQWMQAPPAPPAYPTSPPAYPTAPPAYSPPPPPAPQS